MEEKIRSLKWFREIKISYLDKAKKKNLYTLKGDWYVMEMIIILFISLFARSFFGWLCFHWEIFMTIALTFF